MNGIDTNVETLNLYQNQLAMLQLEIKPQETYSRLKLVLRVFFGLFYIVIPHLILLLFVIMWAKFLWIYTTFYILIRGTYPQKVWNYQLGLMYWLARLHLSVYNLRDDYPKFGWNTESNYIIIEVPFNEAPDRLWVLLRFIFMGVLLVPHIIVWMFRNMWSFILSIMAFFAVLFTGKYPQNWFEFNVGTLNWVMRILGYQMYLFDEYPPFSGK
tara:strand:- start:52504 stop:53142 length:639 start_codon:yes stop_codon:yes gene_type:complete